MRHHLQIAALLTLRDHVIAPLLTAAGTPLTRPRPAHPTRIDHDYDMIRNAIHYLFQDLGISTARTAIAVAATSVCQMAELHRTASTGSATC